MPKHDLTNALKGMGVRAGQRLQLDEPAPAPVALVTESVALMTEPAAAPSDVEKLQPEKRLVAPPKLREKKRQQVVDAKHMGTIETPYVRQRDNTPTRKVSVILPVDLARELQLHCVQTGQRTNTFHEEALRAALARATGRGSGR